MNKSRSIAEYLIYAKICANHKLKIKIFHNGLAALKYIVIYLLTSKSYFYNIAQRAS